MRLPLLMGNWIDLLIIFFVGFYLWESWNGGFLRLLFDFFTLLAALICGMLLYRIAAAVVIGNFSIPYALANALTFAGICLIIQQITSHMLSPVYDSIPRLWHHHRFNKLFSIVAACGNAGLITILGLIFVTALPLDHDLKDTIVTAQMVKPILSKVQLIEKQTHALFGDAFSNTLNFLTIETTSKEQVKLNFTQNTVSVDEVSEKQLITLINRERTVAGLKTLEENARLQDLARSYGKQIFASGLFSHTDINGETAFTRMEKFHIQYRAAGENLAMAPGVFIAHQGLMQSKTHRENILSDKFSKIGIGVIDGGIYGKVFVEEFTD